MLKDSGGFYLLFGFFLFVLAELWKYGKAILTRALEEGYLLP